MNQEENNSGNKRIVKNTAVLYARMIVMMAISFFTTRLTLSALGVTDYGVNNVVGGLVSLFSLLSNSLSTATGRFLTFGLGEGDMEKLKKTFSMSVNIHIVLALIVIVAIETIGVWFLDHKMTIPADRLTAAHWVLQCSVVAFAVGLFSVPYNAAIIAHEKMSAFAYMTIFDAISRLLIVFGIYYYGGDRLILFAILTLIQSLIRQAIYQTYCRRKFEECTYRWGWDARLGKSMFSFAGWNFIGCTAGLMKDQGVNIVINLFSGPAVNAARGIAMQVNGIIGQFIGSFTMALNPQIIKDYAAGELEQMHKLIFWGTRLSYYLFMFLSIPIFFEIEKILQIWLGQVPEHTVLFARLVLVLSLAEIISNTLITAQMATGDIRNYQIVVGGILLLNLPVSYLLLRIGMIPEMTVAVAIVISQICLIARLWFLRSMIKLSARRFLRTVYFNVLGVTAIAVLPPMICYCTMSPDYIRLFVLCTVSCISSGIVIYYIGCNREERKLILKYVQEIKHKLLKK